VYLHGVVVCRGVAVSALKMESVAVKVLFTISHVVSVNIHILNCEKLVHFIVQNVKIYKR